MSNRHWDHEHDDVPRSDRWLAVTASSVIPASVALLTPSQLFIPLCVTSAFLFVAGLVILIRQESRRPRTSEPRPRTESSAPPRLQLEDQ
jgi:hypothetical protein